MCSIGQPPPHFGRMIGLHLSLDVQPTLPIMFSLEIFQVASRCPL